MTREQLNAYLIKQMNGADAIQFQSNFEKLYRDSFAIDSVNKYDSGYSLGSKEIKEVLEANDFQTVLSRVGYNLSYHGKGYGIVLYRYNGDTIIDNVRIFGQPKYIFKELVDIYFFTDDKFKVGEKELQVFGRFYKIENEVFKETGYFNGSQWTITDDAIKYDTDFIPVLPMENNALGTPDILPSASALLKMAQKMVNMLPNEVEKSKIIFAFNEYLNSSQGAKEFEKEVIEGGSSTFSTTDPDNVIGNAVSTLSGISTSVDMLQRVVGFIDGRIRELSFMFRDHGSDTRKNEYDLLIFNQKAFEYMTAKLKFRQRQLQKLIDMIALIEGVETKQIKLVMSEFEQNRIDNLNAIAELKKAQADQARGIATKNLAEAESLKNGMLEPVDPKANVTGLNEVTQGE